MMLTRLQLRDRLTEALRADPAHLALFEGGSAAFDRADDQSDLDLALIVRQGAVRAALDQVDAALGRLGTVTHRWDVPRTLVEGHAQRFWRLEEAGPLVLVDLTVMPEDTLHFLDPSRHGEPVVCFDRAGLVRPIAEDPIDHARRRRQAIDQIRLRFPLFGAFAAKEARRGRALDALAMWQRMVVGPLVTLLRAKHCPERWDFGQRYLHEDLPAPVVERLVRLAYVSEPADLVARWPEAESWVEELLDDR